MLVEPGFRHSHYTVGLCAGYLPWKASHALREDAVIIPLSDDATVGR